MLAENCSPTYPESFRLKKAPWLNPTTNLKTHIGLPSNVYLDVLQQDTATPLTLELQQFVGVFPLFVGLWPEELGYMAKGNVIPVEVGRLQKRTEIDSYSSDA